MILSGACSAWASGSNIDGCGDLVVYAFKGSAMRIGQRFITGILSLLLAGLGGGWSPDRPGQSYAVSAAALPSPGTTADPDKEPPKGLTWPADAAPQVPKGFSISAFAR